MLKLKILVKDKSKVIAFLKTLSFVSTEYILLEPNGTLTVRLKDVKNKKYNISSLLESGELVTFSLLEEGLKNESTTINSQNSEEEEKEDVSTTIVSAEEEIEPVNDFEQIDSIIQNSDSISSFSLNLYQYLGAPTKQAPIFGEMIVTCFDKYKSKTVTIENIRRIFPGFTEYVVTNFRKAAKSKGYKVVSLIRYILSNKSVENLAKNTDKDNSYEEEIGENLTQKKDYTDSAVTTNKTKTELTERKPLLDCCIPSLISENANIKLIDQFENYLLNCDKSCNIEKRITRMLEIISPGKTCSTFKLLFISQALQEKDIESFITNYTSGKDENFVRSATIMRANLSTLANNIMHLYNDGAQTITLTTFLESIRPYLLNRDEWNK